MAPESLAMSSKAALSCLFYSACSVSMTLVNKAVMSSFGFHFNSTVLLMQGSTTTALLLLASALGYVKIAPLTWKSAKQWLPINVLFVCMLFTSFKALRFLAVPVVTIFKNMTNIITLAGAWYLYGESASAGIVCSLLLCVAGAVMAGVSDVAPSVEGYVWMVLNCVCTAAFVLYMRAAVKMKLSVFEKAYYNNVLMLPMAASLALTLGEWPGAWQAEQWTWPAFSIAVAFSGAVGFFLNMASIWCVDMTGATTYAMVGALNKVPVTFIGYALFASPISSKQWFFIVLSLAGGLLYAYVKASEGRGGKAPAKSPPPLPTPDGPGDQEQATPSHSAP